MFRWVEVDAGVSINTGNLNGGGLAGRKIESEYIAFCHCSNSNLRNLTVQSYPVSPVTHHPNPNP